MVSRRRSKLADFVYLISLVDGYKGIGRDDSVER